MKKFMLFCTILFVASILISCDDDDDGAPSRSTVCKIVSESISRDTDTRFSEYIYDEVSGLLVKINYSETSTSEAHGYDTLIYNSGKLTAINTYLTGEVEAYKTMDFTYTEGKITKIVEDGMKWNENTEQQEAFTTTADITYSGSNIATITVSGDGGDNMGFKDFVYVDGNLSTVKIDFSGENTTWSLVEAKTYDSKNNISKVLIPRWDNILFGSSTHNMLLLVASEEINMGDQSLAVGDTLFYKDYTYDGYNNVLTITSHVTKLETKETETTYVWECTE